VLGAPDAARPAGRRQELPTRLLWSRQRHGWAPILGATEEHRLELRL